MQPSGVHRFKSLELRADLLEAKHNNNQEEIASLSALLDADCETLNRFFLESSEGAVSGEPTAPASSLSLQTEEESDRLIAESQNAASSGDWYEAKSLLASISNKRISGPCRRKLDLQREESIRDDEALEREAKQAELEGDWDRAKSLLSSIKSDFGKFLLLALEYTKSRLSNDEEEEYLDLIRQLQQSFADQWLGAVEKAHLFHRATRLGPPGRAKAERGRGILWEKPDGFREIFVIIAENMRYIEGKRWYGLPLKAPSPRGDRQRKNFEEQRDFRQGCFRLAQAELQESFKKAEAILDQIPTYTGDKSGVARELMHDLKI